MNSRLLQTSAFAILTFVVFIPAGGLFSQSAPERVYLKLPRKGEVMLNPGTVFKHYRFALQFTLPVKSKATIRGRGNFPMVEIQPHESPRYYILHTSFRIRRKAGARKILNNIFAPCLLPDFPETDGQVEASCRAEIGLNRLERRIRLIRKGKLLHLFYITYRLAEADLASRIVNSIETNTGFYYKEPLE